MFHFGKILCDSLLGFNLSAILTEQEHSNICLIEYNGDAHAHIAIPILNIAFCLQIIRTFFLCFVYKLGSKCITSLMQFYGTLCTNSCLFL